jgi:hypothetical protein
MGFFDSYHEYALFIVTEYNFGLNGLNWCIKKPGTWKLCKRPPGELKVQLMIFYALFLSSL